MASTSSREAALERRRALTTAGKTAVSRYSSSPGRVRTAADALASRPQASASPSPSAPPASYPRQRPAAAPSPSAMATPNPALRGSAQRISNPSRDLALARREALSRRGKRADTSRDRNRAEVARQTPPAQAPAPVETSSAPAAAAGSTPSRPRLSLGAPANGSLSAIDRRGKQRRAAVQHNPGRALVLARREALSKRGKSASLPGNGAAAAVARQNHPDLSTKELALKLRELKSKMGSAGCARSSGTRPTGPNRHGARQAAAADAHWKVGVSETPSGQLVTGTQANRSPKTTGNEAATCRPITGTEYLGAEVFQTFCQNDAPARQPAKVRLTATSHGNRVTGNEVGRSEKVTGDEPGTCKIVTGTEYISANQSASYCGTVPTTPRKVGRSETLGGQRVSGVMVGRSERVTGDEPGSGLHLTGDQYLGAEGDLPGRAPAKVANLHTLRGTGITGTAVGRSERVTGDEPGSCRTITGDEYIGTQQYKTFCGTDPAPEAAKVGFSVTNRAQVVSGTRTGRSGKVTGDEPGTCKAVTGTPYAGLEQASDYCATPDVRSIRQRTPVRGASRMSGIQPGIGGVMTGAERGACEDVTGTPYVGADQQQLACGAAPGSAADYPQPLDGSLPWLDFSVQSPARAAQIARQRSGGVTGTSYEQGHRITGPFDLAGGKVTGTEQFRFDRKGAQISRGPIPMAARSLGDAAAVATAGAAASAPARPVSRVTGEGISTGLKITGDDWDRGEHVTGTEGASARRRNPSRPGPMSAMPGLQPKRNEDKPEPVSLVTGSSGNTHSGSLITVSGGARG
ncbi:MAG: CsoS2 family carboxysome shell protein [Cyanobacteria bacterium J06638_7]